MAELHPVVGETDGGASQRHEEHRQRLDRVLPEDEPGHGGGDQDQQAAHRRRPLLDAMALGALLADELAELVAAQELDELRAGDDADHERDQAGEEDLDHC